MDTALKERIRNKKGFDLICSPEDAALKIQDGMIIGVSGFTPSAYPKAVPLALAKRADSGEKFKVDLYTGASVGPEIDATWAEAGIIRKRLPYHTDETIREKINIGEIQYVDMHLSQSSIFRATNKVKSLFVSDSFF